MNQLYQQKGIIIFFAGGDDGFKADESAQIVCPAECIDLPEFHGLIHFCTL